MGGRKKEMITVPEENYHKPESQGICQSCHQQEEKGDQRMYLKVVADGEVKLLPHYNHEVQPIQ